MSIVSNLISANNAYTIGYIKALRDRVNTESKKSLDPGRCPGRGIESSTRAQPYPRWRSDFLATAYKKIGINPEKEYISDIGRPFKLADTGKPIDFLLA